MTQTEASPWSGHRMPASRTEALDKVAEAMIAIDEWDIALTTAALDARDLGATWQQIGDHMGVHRFTASQRFDGLQRGEHSRTVRGWRPHKEIKQ